MGNKTSASAVRYIGTAPRYDFFKTGDLVFFGNLEKEKPGAPVVWEHVGVVCRFPTLYAEECETLLLEYADVYHEKLDDYSCMHRASSGVRLVNMETRIRSASHQVVDVLHYEGELSKDEVEIFSAFTELLHRPGDELGQTNIFFDHTIDTNVPNEVSMPELVAKIMTSIGITDQTALKNFTPSVLYRKINEISRVDFHYQPPLRVRDTRVC